MSRPLEPAVKTALDKPILPLAAIVYLDILDDPLFAWSGFGDLVFAAGQTGDISLDGKTFKGTGTIIEVSAVSEGMGGSDALEISMPGVDPYEPLMRQLVTNRNRWQFRRAVVWLMLLDPDTDAIVGKPFRIKTGRMDKMPYSETDEAGVIKVSIEGQQAYGNAPLGTRYSESRDIDPRDNSQSWVHSLANMTAAIGQATAQPGTGGAGGSFSGGSGSGSGSGGGNGGGGSPFYGGGGGGGRGDRTNDVIY